jgi:large subunit ribosomal protein L15
VKLHDLKPAPGSTKRRTRVGRGIAAGKGKTAGRGTKGQKSRSGARIPAWFEGGQTPIHVRVPKLRGFKRRGRIEYQVVNVGRISEYAAAGRFGADAGGTEPLTVNAEILAAAGLISHADRPVKVLGSGDLDVKVFVAADKFTGSAKSKIEAAGGYVQALAPEPEVSPQEPPGDAAADEAPEATTEAADATTEAAAAPANEAEAPAEEAVEAKADEPSEAATDEPGEAVAQTPTSDDDKATE